jgi:hypothetical protein
MNGTNENMEKPDSDLMEATALVTGMAMEGARLKKTVGGDVTDSAADWLAAHYASEARTRLAGAEDAQRWEVLRAFVKDWHYLRRGDHAAARLQPAREKLEFLRANTKTEKEKEFWEWTKKAKIRKKLFPEPKAGGISKKTIRKIERELRLF